MSSMKACKSLDVNMAFIIHLFWGNGSALLTHNPTHSKRLSGLSEWTPYPELGDIEKEASHRIILPNG